MQTIAARESGDAAELNVKRLELKRACATPGIASGRQADFDREIEQRRQEEFARSYTPPPCLRELAMRMIGI